MDCSCVRAALRCGFESMMSEVLPTGLVATSILQPYQQMLQTSESCCTMFSIFTSMKPCQASCMQWQLNRADGMHEMNGSHVQTEM